MQNTINIQIETEFLYDGIILRGDVYYINDKNEMIKILNKNEPMPQSIINFLKENNIKYIYYEKPDIISQNQNLQNMISRELFKEALNTTKNVELAVLSKSLLPSEGINKLIENFYNTIENAPKNSILNLLELKEYDDYTYTHSINVCLISLLFATSLNIKDKNELLNLGIGALLHDIGKLLIPKEILNKTTSLTEEEWKIIKRHPIYGINILKGYSNYNSKIQDIILNHHERYDGKGYPMGIKSNKLSLNAQIVSITHYFDALISNKPYRDAIPMWKAVIQINKEIGTKFSPQIGEKFVNLISSKLFPKDIFPVNTYVKLNTNEIAKVVKNFIDAPLRPIVDIYVNYKNETLWRPIRVNLKKDYSRSIETIIEYNNEK